MATTPNHLGTSKQLLEPIERISEVLFGLGYAYGRCTARNPWFRGVVMVIVGGAMVALCKAVGG